MSADFTVSGFKSRKRLHRADKGKSHRYNIEKVKVGTFRDLVSAKPTVVFSQKSRAAPYTYRKRQRFKASKQQLPLDCFRNLA